MKITFNSPVILTFSFLCAGVYLLNHTFGLAEDLFKLMPIWDFGSGKWYFRLFSNAFGHGNSDHLMGNLAFVLLLGPIIEEKYGSKNTALMLFTTALVCSLIHLSYSSSSLWGASGIVFMLILLTSLVNFKQGEIPLSFLLIVLVYIGKEIMGTFSDDTTSHMTHIVGGIVGAVFGFMMNKRSATKAKKVPANPMDSLP
ncbi:MAG: rhomboid family intramembrane serine protease [Crocinitomix sp.]|nr:rhomboid family intramembrane serine protease [Crocinitomix sp.]